MNNKTLSLHILALVPLAGCPTLSSSGVVSNECDLAQLSAGKVISSRVIERDTGKPVVESIEFEIDAGASLCIVVQTGSVDASGAETHPAPASIIGELDSEAIITSSDFNAHHHVLARKVAASDLGAGTHELSIELRGKPGAVATVSVLAVGEGSDQGFSPSSYARFADLGAMVTTIEDELVVGAALDTTGELLQQELAELPFPAFVVGRSTTSPIFQVHLPGASIGDPELGDHVDAIESLVSVEFANLHRATYLTPNHDPVYPAAGQDPEYFGGGGVLDDQAAWHLDHINAGMAWYHQRKGAPIGILDSGFDMNHADLVNAVCTDLDGDCAPPSEVYVCAGDPCADPGATECVRGPNSQACADFIECSGANVPDGLAYHGNAVAGVAAARSNASNTVGVSWNSTLYVDSFFDDVSYGVDGEALEAVYGQVPQLNMLAALDQFVTQSDPARVINVSLGERKFCKVSGEQILDDAAREDLIDDYAEMFVSFLRSNRDVLVVMSVGNEGADQVYAHEVGGACSLYDPDIADRVPVGRAAIEQVLCVGASTDTRKIASYTNWGGSLLVAPVGGSGPSPTSIFGLGADDGTGLVPLSGTSFASPQVAGALSLMLEANPALRSNHAKKIVLDTAGDAYGDYSLLDLHQALIETEAWTCDNFEADAGDVCPSFWDVPEGSRYHDSIEKLACHCVVKGYGEGKYGTHDNVRRSEMLKIIIESIFPQGVIASYEGVGSFPDVSPQAWYAKYAALGQDLGFITGINGEFRPDQFVTRSEAVVMLVRAAYALDQANDDDPSTYPIPAGSLVAELSATYVGLNGHNANPMPPVVLSYPDVSADAWFAPSAESAARSCAYTGSDHDTDETTVNHFVPGEELTRGEAAHLACLARFDGQGCSARVCLE